MAKGLNKVMLIGHLGADPETRYTATGTAMSTISVATNSATKDQQTGQWQEVTEWHRVVLFDKLAEVTGQYLRKGSQVYIEGRLRTRKWQDQSGQDRWTTEIVAHDMQMLGGRGDAMPTNAPPANSYNAPAPKNTDYTPPPSYSAPQPTTSPTGTTSSNNFDDDIPF